MKITTLTTSSMVLAGLLCAAPGAWADGRYDRDRHHDQYNRFTQRVDAGDRQGTWWRGRYADAGFGGAFGNVVQGVDENKSKRANPRLGTDRNDNRRRDDRRDNRRSTGERPSPSTMPYRSQPRLGTDRNDNRRDYRRDERRDDRRVERRDDRRTYQPPRRVYQPLPPSQIYRAVPQQHERVYRDRDRNSYRAPSGWVLDRRYSHDHYYPPRGYVFDRLPREHHIVHYHGVPYYYWSGIWYRPSGVRFIVVSPPLGIVVPFLPLYYTTLWISGIPYYYADGVYYRYSAVDAGYVVVEAPGDNTSSSPVPPQEELYIYPAKGQSAEQQANDRYECHVWAVQQTNFDPTQPPSGLSQQQFADQRAEYLRAMTACLEGRGYTVK